MMKNILSIIIVLLCFNVKAQNCGFDHILLETINNDPSKIASIEQNIATQSQQQQTNKTMGGAPPLFIIPLVIHVVHDGGISNISDAQVIDAVAKLNEDFKKLNVDTSGIINTFKSIAGDAQFEFRLATIDPNGNCTKGITRTFSYLTNVGSGEPIKDLIGWDTKKYYNVWVVNYLESGGTSVGGYCYLPGTAPSQSHEGTILTNRQFGSIGTSYGVPSAIHTLSHETGHFFGLLHTWGLNAIGTFCGDDGIADTPPTKGSIATCNTNQNTCSGIENVQNFMDYSTCSCMFTTGQINYMRSAAASAVGYRSSLSNNGNLLATGTENNHTIHECLPNAEFKVHKDSTFFCAGRSISFDDLSYNDSLSVNRIYEWTFFGGTPSTSTAANPTVTYPIPGVYDVKLKVSNSNGSDSIIKTNYIQVLEISSSNTVGYFEGFEDSGFPNNLGSNNDWTIVNPGALTKFKRTTVTKKSGVASLVLDLHSESGYGNSEMWHYLMSPNFNLSAQSDSMYLDFNFAYAQRNASSLDFLWVFVSTDCGVNWTFKKSMNNMQLATKTAITADFVPGISEWGSVSIDLSAFAGNPSLRILFAVNAKGGNKLYLDNINLYHINVGVQEYEVETFLANVYPNPIESSSVVEIISAAPENFSITAFDALGKQIGNKVMLYSIKQNKTNVESLFSEFSSGIYYLQINTGTEIKTIKIIK